MFLFFCSPGEAQNIMKKGDILLVVNEHVVLNDDFNDIVTYLETLRLAQFVVEFFLKFLSDDFF